MLCYNCFTEYDGNNCPHCGYNPEDDEGKYPHALKPGKILNGCYILGRVIGQGGFGITYIAQDFETKELVAIKEYLPEDLSTRQEENSMVIPFSGERTEFFTYGKDCFLEEAKTLAEFRGNQNIVSVSRYFEENGTAYLVMEYIKGIGLDKYVKGKGGTITAQEAGNLLLPIMDALDWVHSKGVIHRDIAPDNIIITEDGNAKLIDFGAARYSMGEKSRSLDVILKHGFAPLEQYARHGRQGAYTDVYALAATYYYSITGHVPPDAIDRINTDALKLPGEFGTELSSEMEQVLLKALAVQISDRYQTMSAFSSAFSEAERAEENRKDNNCQAENEILPSTDESDSLKACTVDVPDQEENAVQTPSALEVVSTEADHKDKPNKNKNKKVITTVLVVLAVVIIGITSVVVLNRGNNHNTEKQDSSEASLSANLENSNPQKLDSDEMTSNDNDDVLDAEKAEKMVALGDMLYHNSNEYKKACELYKKALKSGIPSAYRAMGMAYMDGFGVEQDFDKAEEYLQIAYDAGDIYTPLALGDFYHWSSDRTDFEKAYNCYIKGLELNPNDKWLNLSLAIMYYNGEYVETDKAKGIELMKKSAELGNPNAYLQLGWWYMEEPNGLSEATYYFSKAADLGNEEAKDIIKQLSDD